MTNIKDIYDLQKVANHEWHKLFDIEEEYLSDAGKAAKEAYQVICWYACFCESLTELITNEDYLNLLEVEGKHPEFYRILNMVNKAIKNIVY